MKMAKSWKMTVCILALSLHILLDLASIFQSEIPQNQISVKAKKKKKDASFISKGQQMLIWNKKMK